MDRGEPGRLSRSCRPVWRALLGGAALGLIAGCGGSVQTDLNTRSEGQTAEIPTERVDQTWPVRMATEADFGPYAAKGGWVSLVVRRNYKVAVEQLGREGGLAGARAHVEAAAVFRQAALLAAHSLIETYGETPEPTDPVGTAHLLTVSYAITGELDKAREASARLEGADDPTLAWHGPWKEWLASGATWPPDLSALPLDLPEPAPGTWASTPSPPHYTLPEQGVDTKRDMADPGVLVALALWHDAAAEKSAGDQAPLVHAYRAGYRLPVEPKVAAAGPLPMELLFGADLLVPEDAAFLVDLHGDKGAAAVDAHKDSSLLAYLASISRQDGKIHAETAIDVVSRLRDLLVERAAARTDNAPQRHQRQFADMAYVGAFRSLALVAEIEGDREVSGLLRINALERSEKATACPVGLLALGAWDASNRYPSRAQEILHAQARIFPSLEIARYGLDVMALRVSRERTGETPGM